LLQELPVPTKVHCAIPNEYFGDLMSILEFLHSFGDILSLKSFFPSGITFDVVERALSVDEVAGELAELSGNQLTKYHIFSNLIHTPFLAIS
jgi:bromodomain adjacent to zinc finger domain protein 1A